MKLIQYSNSIILPTYILILRFINSLCVITIRLNTLTDVPYQMTVDGAFVYVIENLRKRSQCI